MNNGDEIFFKVGGRVCFLETLGEGCWQTGWQIHVYVLTRRQRYAQHCGQVSNPYHRLLEAPEANLVEEMKGFQGT